MAIIMNLIMNYVKEHNLEICNFSNKYHGQMVVNITYW